MKYAQVSSGREAKEFVISQIVFEAQREGTPLSQTEQKMMYFTETAWTIPDVREVSAAFDRDYDQLTYEAKIGELVQKARARLKQANEVDTWNEAVRALAQGDHYLLVLLAAPIERPKSLFVDRVKLVGTALLVCRLLLLSIFLFRSKN